LGTFRYGKSKALVELNQIILGDCLEVTKEIPDKSANLIIADIPYNIGKGDWDKWKKQGDYINYIGERFLECQRVLADNGSFYWFHNDFLQMVELQNFINQSTKFIFKQLIVWNKKFKGCSNEGYLQGYNEVENLRNYQKMAEYVLFYTFQDETGLTTVMLDVNNFPTLRKYFKEFLGDTGLSQKQIIETIGQKADHCFRWRSTQWDLCTPETYAELLSLPTNGFVRREYESLRQEYEGLRYTFNEKLGRTNVWEYTFRGEKREPHPTQKPISLIKDIVRCSSKENDLILDPFSGSGTTAIACLELNRNFICIEKDPKYYELSVKRVNDYKSQVPMEFLKAI